MPLYDSAPFNLVRDTGEFATIASVIQALFIYFSTKMFEGDIVNTLFTAQVQSDLNKLPAEAAVEHSSISVDTCYDSKFVCTRCLKKGSMTALRRCTGCKSSSYCSKDCQRLDWPSHKQLCKSIQSQNPQI